MFSRKKKIAEFEQLNPEIAKQIPSIHEHPELVAACKKRDDLKDKVKKIRSILNFDYRGPEGETMIASAEKDAAAILDGVAPEKLPGQSTESSRKILARQLTALETAITMQECQISEVYTRVIREGCDKLEPIAMQFIKNTIEAFEKLKTCLEAQEVFFQFMARQGYDEARRPKAVWRSWPFEQQVLYSTIEHSSLAYYLDQRRKSIGLPIAGKKHKPI